MSNSDGTVEVLDHAGCVALLSSVGVGRVVFTHRAMPAVRPVRFAVHGDEVLFRARSGDAWVGGVLGTVVAFSADEMVPDMSSGWFVTVLGRATEVQDPRTLEELSEVLPIPAGCRCIRVSTESVTGRRVSPSRRPCEAAHS